MEEKNLDCCCCNEFDNKENCVVCGKPLVYFNEMRMLKCSICGKEKSANASCVDGHFVCDDCHSGGGAEILSFLMKSKEKDPVALFLQVCALKSVHMHGPEHHSIIPCVLVTAYRNNGGEIDFEDCLNEAWNRGKKVPGGACGFLGACGAAVGAGIFASILCEATPLTGDVWHVPQEMTMECLKRLIQIGGPRCCKRVGRQAIEAAVEHVKERYGIEMPLSKPVCSFSHKNRECLHERCPYFTDNV